MPFSNQNISPTIIKTADGSHSIFIEKLNEHYHSIHGAIQESKHVFIEAGLKHFVSSQNRLPSNFENNINILEIGLGTGLNALLTFIEAEKSTININYTAIEAYPISIDLASKLNYIECLDALQHQIVFNTIHSCDWDTPIPLSTHFTITKIRSKLQEVVLKDKYNIIYFDAFGPPVQPEMWKEEIFTELAAALETMGYLVTYCAKGEVKRILKKVGLTLESLQGPPGKREMIRAMKK